MEISLSERSIRDYQSRAPRRGGNGKRWESREVTRTEY
jgi:hypothetical protein